MNYKDFYQSKLFLRLLYVIGGVAVLLIVFYAGMVAGSHRALFAVRWGENYERNFLGSMRGSLLPREGRGLFPNSHGTFGPVLKIDSASSTLAIAGDDGVEKSVLVGTSTIIRRYQSSIKITDLKVGDDVVVFGAPNQLGQITAGLIRVLPSPSGTPAN